MEKRKFLTKILKKIFDLHDLKLGYPLRILTGLVFLIRKIALFSAGYFGIRKKDAESKVNELFDKLGLNEKRNSRLRQLSGGMKEDFK